MFKAQIVKAFKYIEVQPAYVVELTGCEPMTRKSYRKGQVVEFATNAELAEFRSTAREFGSDVKCVGLPARA